MHGNVDLIAGVAEARAENIGCRPQPAYLIAWRNGSMKICRRRIAKKPGTCRSLSERPA